MTKRAKIMAKYFRIILSGICVGILYIVFRWTTSLEQLKGEIYSNTSSQFTWTELLIPNTIMNVQQKGSSVSNSDSKFKSPYMGGPQRYNVGVKKSPPGRHEILWWNEPEWMKRKQRNMPCDLSLCAYPNCVLSRNRSLIKQSSVVLVGLAKHDDATSVLKHRTNKDQAWVFFTMEAPQNKLLFSIANKAYDGVFNWSMTYIRDSDIFMPYDKLGYRSTPLDRDYPAIFRGKTKQVAWLVSHCHSEGNRDRYVEELQKYVQVDVFGKCVGRPVQKEDVKGLLAQYKFYLGFESTFCRDYVTEKYFGYMQHDLIVVVRGLTDYNSLLPHHTFINTADFGSIKQLGKYLNQLSNDENEYISYLKEKDKYFVYDRRQIYCDGLCTICEKVNNLQENRRTYDSVIDWMGKCKPAADLQ